MSLDQLPETVRACCDALDDKKAEDITVLHFGPEGPIADDFIIATGTSEPHLRALLREVEARLDAEGLEYISSQRGMRTGWMIIDAHDLVIHVFTKESRRYFNLEGLWKDAQRFEFMPSVAVAPGIRN